MKQLPKYPANLRGPLLSGNSRKQNASFTMTETRNGMPYIKNLPHDQPIFYSITFRFKGDERILFWSWFKHTIDGGRKPFLMKLLTEEGEIEHECRFTDKNLMDMTADTSNVFTYKASILAREILTPMIDTLVGIDVEPELFMQRDILDGALNANNTLINQVNKLSAKDDYQILTSRKIIDMAVNSYGNREAITICSN